MTLSASVYDEALKQEKSTGETIKIFNEIGGVSINKKNKKLELILYDDEQNQLRIMGIDHLVRKSDMRLDIPLMLPDDEGIDFIEESRFVPAIQGASKIKVIKEGNILYLTIDKTYYESTTSNPHTAVVKFDLNKRSHNLQKISKKSSDDFRSFISHNVFYRSIISKKDFSLEMFSLGSGKLINSTTIVKDPSQKYSYVYFLNNKAYSIHKKETLYTLLARGKASMPSVVVPMQKDSCTKTIIWGTSFQEKGGIGSPAGILTNPFVGMASMVLGTAIKQMVTMPL